MKYLTAKNLLMIKDYKNCTSFKRQSNALIDSIKTSLFCGFMLTCLIMTSEQVLNLIF